MRHKRAVNRMIRKLGGFKPFPDYDTEDKEEETKQDPVYIPIPVPNSYFNDEADEEKINKPKNK